MPTEVSTSAMLTQANKAYELGQFERALFLYQELAHSGYPHGLLIAARMYIDGRGTTVNLPKAKELLDMAESLGVREVACQRAALALAEGDQESYFLAMRQAALQGILPARYEFARAYLSGVGIMRDEQRGIELMKDAAQHGHLGAKMFLVRRRLRSPLRLLSFIAAIFELIWLITFFIYLTIVNPEDEKIR